MKIIIKSLWLVMLLVMCFQAQAQQTKLYRFSLKSTEKSITVSTKGVLSLDAKQTGENSSAQYFTVKDLGNGHVCLASAVNPALFLKHSGTTVALGNFVKDEVAYEWQIIYSGYPYASIADPLTNAVLSWRDGSGFIMMTVAAPLNSNNDIAGDHFRFELDYVAGTF